MSAAPKRPRRAPWGLLADVLDETDPARQLAIVDEIAPYVIGLSAQDARMTVCYVAAAMLTLRRQWEEVAELLAPDRAPDGSLVFTASGGERVTVPAGMARGLVDALVAAVAERDEALADVHRAGKGLAARQRDNDELQRENVALCERAAVRVKTVERDPLTHQITRVVETCL